MARFDAHKLPSFLSTSSTSSAHARSGLTVRLADVIEHGVQVSWSEAVAIVQTLCEQQAAGSAQGPYVPEPAGIWLTDAGAMIVEPGAQQPDAAQRAARLLGSLLTDRTLPVRLRLFIIEAVSPSSTWSLADFTNGLRTYERGDRPSSIRDVCQRAAQALRSGGAAVPAPAVPPPSVPLPKVAPSSASGGRVPVRARRASRVAVAVVCGVLVVGGAIALSRYGALPRVSGLFGTDASNTADTSQDVVSGTAGASDGTVAPSSNNAARGTTASSSRVASSRETRVARSPGSTQSRGETRSTDASGSSSRQAATSGPSGGANSSGGGAARVARSGPSVGAHDQVQAPSEGTRLVPVLREIDGYDEEVLPANVYSSANLDVEPPVAVRQQLPGGFIDPSRNDVSSMEIWVSDTGNVLRVRLNQGTSMVHAMLLSAAKTWRFRPATLDGRPVPYKLEQRWVVTPP